MLEDYMMETQTVLYYCCRWKPWLQELTIWSSVMILQKNKFKKPLKQVEVEWTPVISNGELES